MSKQSFLKGALILIIASVITRFLGIIMQVYTSRLMQAEGVGLFRLVWPTLSLLITLATLGLPTAISKVVSESAAKGDWTRVRRVMKFSFLIVTLLSLSLTAFFLVLAPWLANQGNNDPRTYYAMLAMAPAVPIICISWVMRGYFQGIQNQTPPAVAWILETVSRVGVGIPMIYLLLPQGLEFAAAGSMIGLVAGEFTGFLYLGFLYLRKYPPRFPSPPSAEPFAQTFMALAEVALPVTFQRILLSIAFALEPMLIMHALQTAGVAKTLATAQYGALSMAITLLLWPTVFTYSLSTTLIPAVSEAVAVQDFPLVRRRLYQSLRLTLLIGLPSSLIFTFLAQELAITIYHEPLAGPLLIILSPMAVFLYLQGPFSGILQGLNRASLQTAISLTGAGIKFLLIYGLASRPDLGIRGVALAIVLSYMVTTVLYTLSVAKLVGISIYLQDTLKIIVSSLIMSVLILHCKKEFGDWPPLMLSAVCLSVALPLYCMLLLLFRVVSLQSLQRIPVIGPLLAGWIRWLPFFR